PASDHVKPILNVTLKLTHYRPTATIPPRAAPRGPTPPSRAGSLGAGSGSASPGFPESGSPAGALRSLAPVPPPGPRGPRTPPPAPERRSPAAARRPGPDPGPPRGPRREA